jgi:hypothetical protein
MSKIWWMGADGMRDVVMAIAVMMMAGTIDAEKVASVKVVMAAEEVGVEGTEILMAIIMEVEVVAEAGIRMETTAGTDEET